MLAYLWVGDGQRQCSSASLIQHELPRMDWKERELNGVSLLPPWCWRVVREAVSKFGKVNLEHRCQASTLPSKSRMLDKTRDVQLKHW
jgi:hypothetical protein